MRQFVLAALCLSAAACARRPAPPYTLNFSVAGSAPRFEILSREHTVPLSIVNTGQRAWDPERIHFSYHWVWLVPRELRERSRWDVPYHNGIRTELPHAVPPGAAIDLPVRVLPPDWPGLYWRQWDMVEEGVAWFAQLAPRQPRELVIVLPPLVWLTAPLPFLVAVAGAFALRRRRNGRIAPIADVCWCATALAAKPMVVVHDALLEPTAAAYWLIAAAALLPPVLALFLPRRLRAWVLFGLGTLGSLIVLADVVYYRFFGDVLSAPALLGIGQTSHVWGSIRSLLSPALFWLVADLPIAFGIAAGITTLTVTAPPLAHRARSAGLVAAGLGLAAGAWSVPATLRSLTLDQMFRDRAVVEQLGVFGFHAYDLWNYTRSTVLRAAPTDADVDAAAEWFRARAPLRARTTAPSFGAARGRNLIVVQVESLQEFAVDFRAGGEDVMPNLRRWTDDSLRFTNVTDQTNEGRTSDAELTALTSLPPLDHGAAAFRFPGNHYTALPRVLTEHGYSTLSAVPFEPGFWNRQVMHPSYGFQKSLFEPDFRMTEQIGWGLNDRDFLQQMVPRLSELPQPFAAWLITLSLHHPFDNFPQSHKTLRLGALEGTSFGNYLHTMHFFDQALEAFRSALAAGGLLDSSVLVVFGDHDAGFVRDPALSRTIGIRPDEIAWTLNDRIPLFVRVPQTPAPAWLHGRRPVAAGQTDLAPTLLSLLGIDSSGLAYTGRDLLGAPDGPVLRPYGEWLSPRNLFTTRGTAPVCRDLERGTNRPGDCAETDREAARARTVGRLVVTADLQERLRAMLGSAQR